MKLFKWSSAVAVVLLLSSAHVLAQATAEGESAEGADQEMQEIQEVIVVTAGRTEQRLHEVPAAMTVLSADQLQEIPADDYGDFLRNVPGLNVSQMSARDIQITGRAATNSLATSELVLMDNRTLYLDFFGFVMWDFVPLDPKEIKQIEVVRGPGSAVWGANAMTGVINLITKSPKEMKGTSVTLGAGEFGTLFGSLTHAAAGEKVGYKFTASYFEQDPYDRPTGSIPGTASPANPGGTPYPPFANKGTEQPKVNLRVDYDPSPDTTTSFSAGYAATDGIIHSGVGPFDIDTGSLMGFGKFDWARRATRFTFFINVLDGNADNLLSVGPDRRPIAFDFKSETYNLDFSDTRILGENNILTYGATARRNNFDLSIAPAGDKRDEFGFFIQDEILIGEKLRWLIGARWDDIDPIGSVVSPRTSLLFAPNPQNSFRVSYNRAFRAPSMINNFLDITIINSQQLPAIPQFGLPPVLLVFPVQALGNPRLTEEQLDAIEVGYVGTYDNGITFTISVYRNEQTDSTDFFTAGFHTNSSFISSLPPLPPFIIDALVAGPLRNLLPSALSYRNIGEIVDKGVEISLQHRPRGSWSSFLNYSYQDEPEVKGIDQVQLPNGTIRDAINTPPEHRANAGIAYDSGRFFGNVNANYQAEAFWTDVLDSRFWGPTDSFTTVGIGAGVRLSGDRVTISVTGQNVFDEDVQQHIFGDILARKVSGQVLFRF